MSFRKCTRGCDAALEVILIDRNEEEPEAIEKVLKDIDSEITLLSFQRVAQVQEYLEHNAAAIFLLEADDEETGWEIPYRKIKSINEAAKVVLVSRNQAAAVKAFEAGVWDYLLKPVQKRQLERVVRKARKHQGY